VVNSPVRRHVGVLRTSNWAGLKRSWARLPEARFCRPFRWNLRRIVWRARPLAAMAGLRPHGPMQRISCVAIRSPLGATGGCATAGRRRIGRRYRCRSRRRIANGCYRPEAFIRRPARRSRNQTFSVAGRRRLCAHPGHSTELAGCPKADLHERESGDGWGSGRCGTSETLVCGSIIARLLSSSEMQGGFLQKALSLRETQHISGEATR